MTAGLQIALAFLSHQKAKHLIVKEQLTLLLTAMSDLGEIDTGLPEDKLSKKPSRRWLFIILEEAK